MQNVQQSHTEIITVQTLTDETIQNKANKASVICHDILL